ncbi:NAD(P)-binding protein [Agrocybe pediades]|nr:NAD(P)-binding protein [Agrocybe pediades]
MLVLQVYNGRGQLGEKVPPAPTKDLKGQTVVVTGANIGIGFEAAKHFARMNPGKLIIACRSKARGEEALRSIRADTGCTTAELRLLDLSNIASVKSFVQTFEDNNDRLDNLVENAAIYMAKAAAEFTEDGWETSVYVNNLATSLLALLLLPRMIDTAKKFNVNPRLVVVGSEVHYWTKFAEKDVFSENFFRTYAYKDSKLLRGRLDKLRYYDTKLLNIFFTRSLAEKLEKGPVIVNTVNPGFCLSNLRRDADGLQAILFWVFDTFLARTAEQGSRQLV